MKKIILLTLIFALFTSNLQINSRSKENKTAIGVAAGVGALALTIFAIILAKIKYQLDNPPAEIRSVKTPQEAKQFMQKVTDNALENAQPEINAAFKKNNPNLTTEEILQNQKRFLTENRDAIDLTTVHEIQEYIPVKFEQAKVEFANLANNMQIAFEETVGQVSTPLDLIYQAKAAQENGISIDTIIKSIDFSKFNKADINTLAETLNLEPKIKEQLLSNLESQLEQLKLEESGLPSGLEPTNVPDVPPVETPTYQEPASSGDLSPIEPGTSIPSEVPTYGAACRNSLK